MEPLLRNIQNNRSIERITSNKLEVVIPKVYGYADDVNAVIRNSGRGVQEIFNEYEKFSRQSGLVLNAGKTETLRFKKPTRVLNDCIHRIMYMGETYELKAADGIKINGILFFQDPKLREEKNLEKVLGAMTKHLTNWSRRHLTLLGKILIIKTYAISQAVFLMQSMMLSEKSLKLIERLVFKFLWSRNFTNGKAPDRIKRKIMLTPCHLGGFGLTDICLMNKSLNLRALGRMAKSIHPMFSQIWSDIDRSSFFSLGTRLAVDVKIKEGLKLMNEKRRQTLRWPLEKVLLDSNLKATIGTIKLKSVLTNLGKQSIAAYRILSRSPNVKLSQLNPNEINNIRRFLVDPEVLTLNRQINNLGVLALGPIVDNSILNELYPCEDYALRPLSRLTSKSLRESFIDAAEAMICIYRSGILLNPGEVLNWTAKTKKLTSTRHKCSILRIAHGDVCSNDRLFRLGLINDPKCLNCDAQSEDISHKLIGCDKAKEAWQILESYIEQLGMRPLENITLENVIGTQVESTTTLALTLRSELLTRLISFSGKTYHPRSTVTACIKTILTVEKMPKTQYELLKSLIVN